MIVIVLCSALAAAAAAAEEKTSLLCNYAENRRMNKCSGDIGCRVMCEQGMRNCSGALITANLAGSGVFDLNTSVCWAAIHSGIALPATIEVHVSNNSNTKRYSVGGRTKHGLTSRSFSGTDFAVIRELKHNPHDSILLENPQTGQDMTNIARGKEVAVFDAGSYSNSHPNAVTDGDLDGSCWENADRIVSPGGMIDLQSQTQTVGAVRHYVSGKTEVEDSSIEWRVSNTTNWDDGVTCNRQLGFLWTGDVYNCPLGGLRGRYLHWKRISDLAAAMHVCEIEVYETFVSGFSTFLEK